MTAVKGLRAGRMAGLGISTMLRRERLDASRPLRRLLRRARRRMRVAWLLRQFASVGPWVALVAGVLVLISRFTPATWGEPSAALLAGAAVVALAAVALGAPVPLRRVAVVADRGLGARDTLVASLEVGDRLDPLACAVRERARAITQTARARRAVPLRPRWALLGLTLCLGAGVVGLALVANPQDARRRERAELRAELVAAADQLRALSAAAAEPGAANPTIAPDPALAKDLAELARVIDEARSLEAGLAALQRAQADLGAGLTADVTAKKAAAAGLERNVQMLPLRGFGNPNEPESAVTQFEKAAKNAQAMTREEQGVLAKRLAQLAESQRLANPTVAQAMNDASAALRANDRAGAEAALNRAAAAQRDAQAAVGAAERRAAAAGALTKPAEDLRSAAQRAAERQSAGVGQPGQAGQGGAGSPGAGNNTTNGVGQGPGWSPRNVFNNEEGSASNAPATVAGSQGGSGSGTSSEAKAADIPGEGGDEAAADESDIQVPEFDFDERNGKLEDFDRAGAAAQIAAAANAAGNEEPGRVIQREQAVGPDGVARVPLSERATTYQAQATAAMQRPDIPPAVRALVSRYFASLTEKKR